MRDLQLVLALAAAGSTSRATRTLHLTQPAISRALVVAEEKLGVQLFERRPRGLSLTEAGERLVAGAPAVLEALGALERSLRPNTPPRTRLRLVCECYTAYRWVPSALRQLAPALPGLELRIEMGHTEDPIAALTRGDIDIALLTTSATRGAGLDEVPLFSDELVFVLAPSHPLAARSRLSADDLRATTLLTSNVPAPMSRWFLAKVFGRTPPRLQIERLPLTEAVLDVARAGHGVAILSEWVVQPSLGHGDLLVKRLARRLERPWRLGFRKEVRGEALRLRSALRASAPRIA